MVVYMTESFTDITTALGILFLAYKISFKRRAIKKEVKDIETRSNSMAEPPKKDTFYVNRLLQEENYQPNKISAKSIEYSKKESSEK